MYAPFQLRGFSGGKRCPCAEASPKGVFCFVFLHTVNNWKNAEFDSGRCPTQSSAGRFVDDRYMHGYIVSNTY